jgi:hypothetical protein
MGRVIRLTEAELTGLLSDIIKMAMDPNNAKDDTSPETYDDDESKTDDKSIGKVSVKGQELLNNPIFKKNIKCHSY